MGVFSIWNALHDDSPARSDINHLFKEFADIQGISVGVIHSFTARNDVC